jgi:hypothetical protein
MSKNRYVNTHFWDDNYILELEPEEKLLFIYFLTNPLTNIAGAYEINLRQVSLHTGIDREVILKMLAKFEQDEKIFFKDGWILILNFIKHQAINPKVTKGIEDAVNHCPDWVRHRLSIAYDSLSHLNLTLYNSNLTLSNGASDTPSAEDRRKGVPVNEKAQAELEKLFSAVKEFYDVPVLPNEARWMQNLITAAENKFAPIDITKALETLHADKSRTYPITPENVISQILSTRARNKQAKPKEEPKKYATRNEEMEARGFPKIPFAKDPIPTDTVH